MATKKAAPKSSTPKAAVKKAAPKKAAAPKAAAAVKKVAPPKKAAAPKAAAPVKKAAPKKAAPAIKLSDAQTSLLKEIVGAGETGLVATKKIQKQLDSLQTKKLIKKGKKEGEFFKYHVTKLGEKHHASKAETTSAPSA